MTLNEIFEAINLLQYHLDDVHSNISTFNYQNLILYGGHYETIRDYIEYNFYYGVTNNERVLKDGIQLLSDQVTKGFSQVNTAIDDIKNVIYSGNHDYNIPIIDHVQSAIGVVWNEISTIETGTGIELAEVQSLINDALYIESENREAEIAVATTSVETSIANQTVTLTDTVTSVADGILTNVAGTVADVYNFIAAEVTSLWDGVVAAYDYVTTKFEEYYIQVTDWVTTKLDELGVLIFAWYDELKGFISDSITYTNDAIQIAKTYLVDLFNVGLITLQSWVETGIEAIESSIAYLTNLTDWRFQFLNIFMVYPELSFLQLLTRDETLFEYYKPYWQALFVRIMEST